MTDRGDGVVDPDDIGPLDVETPPPLSALLDRVVRGMGAPGVDAVELVFNRWDEVVGGVLAARTRPTGIADGVIVIEADEPAVVSHVRYLERELVGRLAELLGAGRVRGIDVRVRPSRRR